MKKVFIAMCVLFVLSFASCKRECECCTTGILRICADQSGKMSKKDCEAAGNANVKCSLK